MPKSETQKAAKIAKAKKRYDEVVRQFKEQKRETLRCWTEHIEQMTPRTAEASREALNRQTELKIKRDKAASKLLALKGEFEPLEPFLRQIGLIWALCAMGYGGGEIGDIVSSCLGMQLLN